MGYFFMGKLAKAITFSVIFGGASGYYLTQTEAGQDTLSRGAGNNDIDSKYVVLFPGNQEVSRNIKLAEDLKELGYDIGKCGANGVYSSDVEGVVTWFQKTQGLKESGVVTLDTAQQLADYLEQSKDLKDNFGIYSRKDASVFMASALPATRKESEKIRQYQVGLIALNYNLTPCYASGEMDKVTVEAVRNFQIDQKIYPVSGHLDHETQNTITAILSEQGQKISVESFMAMQAGNVDTNNPVAQELATQMRIRYINETSELLKQNSRMDGYILDGIKTASLQTGWDMEYLVQLAKIESSNTPWAKAQDNCPKDTICSAVGPFQFIKSTWLRSIKKFGSRYGYKNVLKAMTGDVKALEYVLDLRKQVDIAASIAADFSRDNYNGLVKRFGTRVGKTEVYMAHFFGLGNSKSGAIKFLTAYHKSPNEIAATNFATEAKSNRYVFYKGGINAPGNQRTFKEIYDMFKKKISPEGQNNLVIGIPIKSSSAKTKVALNR